MRGFKKPERGLLMSSSDIAIAVDSLSKRYEVYARPGDRLKQFVIPKLYNLLGSYQPCYFKEFWALKDISFEVAKGQVVGIVGRNGSGKSSLLQIICGTLAPTLGGVRTKGRISALLELGSGFNPDFTGRENVFMNASVLGMSRKEIQERFSDIVDFSEIGEFIDQPVKTYSSGMAVRLAFSVAINVDPEVLIVDEALSVGDELFQRKCFSKLETMRKKGTTILFVSHSGHIITELCDHALLVDAGEKLLFGEPKHVVGLYQKLLYADQEKQGEIREKIKAGHYSGEGVSNRNTKYKEKTATLSHEVNQKSSLIEFYDENLKPKSTITYESNSAVIESPGVYTLSGEQVNHLQCHNTYVFSYRVRFFKDVENVSFGMLIKTKSGVELGGAITAPRVEDSIRKVMGGSVIEVMFHFRCTLNPGVYFLNAGATRNIEGGGVYLHRILDACMFRVIGEKKSSSTGMVNFDCFSEVREKSDSG